MQKKRYNVLQFLTFSCKIKGRKFVFPDFRYCFSRSIAFKLLYKESKWQRTTFFIYFREN